LLGTGLRTPHSKELNCCEQIGALIVAAVMAWRYLANYFGRGTRLMLMSDQSRPVRPGTEQLEDRSELGVAKVVQGFTVLEKVIDPDCFLYIGEGCGGRSHGPIREGPLLDRLAEKKQGSGVPPIGSDPLEQFVNMTLGTFEHL
jgi:hypothetical protein